MENAELNTINEEVTENAVEETSWKDRIDGTDVAKGIGIGALALGAGYLALKGVKKIGKKVGSKIQTKLDNNEWYRNRKLQAATKKADKLTKELAEVTEMKLHYENMETEETK